MNARLERLERELQFLRSQSERIERELAMIRELIEIREFQEMQRDDAVDDKPEKDDVVE